MSKNKFQIAIDGPAGAGKSTIARQVAEKLGFIYIDTGAMYRAIGVFFQESYGTTTDEKIIEKHINEAKISLEYIKGEQRIFLNGKDVSERIRIGEAGMWASNVSKNLLVRKSLVALQQEMAGINNVVMDGRDIGTVVLPKATLKIFLTASVEVRAKRRMLQLREKGINEDLLKIQQEIRERDYQDTHRENSPLRQAEDAVAVDTSNMTIDQVVEEIIRLKKARDK